jgi:hypothetical protein
MKTKTILILAGVGALVYYFYNKSKDKKDDTTTTAPTKPKFVKKVVQKATAMQTAPKTK